MDALILAGGENKRIPVTKGFLKLNGRTIIESNIELLKGIFDRVIVSTNVPELYFSLGVSLVGDVSDARGPMTGIFSALIGQEVSEVFVTACDMPFINGILIKYMIDRWNSNWDAMVPIFESKPQPLHGIYAKKLVDKMEDSIASGNRSLREFLKKANVLYIGEEEVGSIDKEGRSFVNINTLEDFQREGGKICLV
jgi:molybdenum cofactor guanylyltransferase